MSEETGSHITPFEPIMARMLDEKAQSHAIRAPLLAELEDELGVPVVSFFTSTNAEKRASIDDIDADTLTGFLQGMDLTRGLALIISSHGGDGVAAERIINICRAYSGTGQFIAIVPGKAKSAATMICFGASSIMMGPTSELGPVDPQIPLTIEGRAWSVPAYFLVKTYDELFDGANTTTGHLEPYLQQLNSLSASFIKYLRSEVDLSGDISIRALKSGMLADLSEEEIKEKVHLFLTPEDTKVHGRPIYADQAIECGLQINKLDVGDGLWRLIYEIYIRTSHFVSFGVAAKCIESKHASFAAQ